MDASPTTTAEQDAHLVQRARAGDEAAWVMIMRNHETAVFRLAYLMLGNGDAAEADDIAQETFIRAYRKLQRFEVGRELRPWLLSIAANLARNRRRSAGRYWGAMQRWLNQRAPELHAPPPELDEAAQMLWQAVQTLKPEAQQAIYLRYFLELSEAETANILGVAIGTVKSRTHRALKALRAKMQETGGY